MRAIFLSDAHLRAPQDTNYQLLLEFLNRQKELDALFLLGDIFEFWLGYQHLVFSHYIPILEQLRRLNANGTRLFFVEGNHDFLLGPYFSETLNCTVISQEQIIEWDRQKLLLCHGDLLNPGPGYRQLRRFWRSPLIRGLSRVIHPDLVWRFAIWLSNKSKKNHPQRRHCDPAPYLRPYLELQPNRFDVMVCGHYHFPRELSRQQRRIIALGDWINQYSYAEMIDGEISLKSFQPR